MKRFQITLLILLALALVAGGPSVAPLGSAGKGVTRAVIAGTQTPLAGGQETSGKDRLSSTTSDVGSEWDVAKPGYEYSFPRDHYSHDDYRIEWWYYTGNLTAADGHRFGYQLTFFRTGIIRNPANPSRWTVRNLYMAHFAISDISNDSFHSFERLNRAGVGWAGADRSSYHVWNEDWSVRLDGSDHILNARNDDYSIDLRLSPQKPEVAQGEEGISRKGPAPGNASHYYSITRMLTSGSLQVGGQSFKVTGSSWMDHEFGSSFLDPGQVGWDWFSIQLDDGRDLMLVQIRHADGSVDSYANGTIVDSAGRARHLKFGDFRLTPGKTWRSQASGANYPVAWTVDIPSEQIHLSVNAAIENQELRTGATTGVTYWEGSVNIVGETSGTMGEASSKPVHGRGYLEMTGYGQSAGLGALMH